MAGLVVDDKAGTDTWHGWKGTKSLRPSVKDRLDFAALIAGNFIWNAPPFASWGGAL